MEYIRTPEGKDIKVIISIAEYEKLQKKVKILDKLEKLNLTPEDLIDLALVRQTRGEDSIPFADYLSKK
ncbi:MAG: hypothetical protein A2V93_02950 [Ignavibacteria bacterium RBG_16_34_14]|nr:MAG: hypothetical protein A2V93_02950 [Ignavibacteria bacterium RBG_16_34_14]